MPKAPIVRLTGLDKWDREDWHMSLMCSLMENDLDEELDKANPDAAKNKKIYTRIGGSIANEAAELVKTVDKGDGVSAYKVLVNTFANKRSLQVVRKMTAVISETRGDETMDKYLRRKRSKIADIEDARGRWLSARQSSPTSTTRS